MKIYELNRDEIIDIYNTRMVKDFPTDELRPLNLILGPYDKGTYLCYALIDELETPKATLGYAFFIKMGTDYLFDYLAISDVKRNSGIGTSFLKLLKEKFTDSTSVIGEVEDPSYAENDSNKDLQTRRLNFYLRNGYLDTGVRVKLFGVDYIVLEMDLGAAHSESEIKELYLNQYKNMLPKKLFDSMVIIK